MVIFMPYYRQRGQLFHSNLRTRPSASSSSNGQNHMTTTSATIRVNRCKFLSNIFCRFLFSLFLLTIALFLFRLSIENESNQKEGSNIIAIILLIIAIVSFIRTCQKLRRYYMILDTRRRLIQRLRERQQAYDLALALNNSENPENFNTDLPSYKELFPSHPDLRNSSQESPPSYDDFVKTLVIRRSPVSLPITSLTNTSSQSQINPTRCIWITDRTRRPLCISGTVTYV